MSASASAKGPCKCLADVQVTMRQRYCDVKYALLLSALSCVAAAPLSSSKLASLSPPACSTSGPQRLRGGFEAVMPLKPANLGKPNAWSGQNAGKLLAEVTTVYALLPAPSAGNGCTSSNAFVTVDVWAISLIQARMKSV